MAVLDFDTVILGAGAAGMMCAAHAAARGGRVLVIDHAKAPGEKIRISGGGRCNFTNLHAEPGAFISANPHFAKSALKRYTQWDFIALMDRYGIAWHEKRLGQLFCDGSAKQVVAMLVEEMERVSAELSLSTAIETIASVEAGYRVTLTGAFGRRNVDCANLVVATGGKSIPKMGATGAAYRIAEQFGVQVTDIRPALVPLTFEGATLERLSALAGVAAEGAATAGGVRFDEAVLFTHRGLSGPAILQASSFWREGDSVTLSLTPGGTFEALKAARATAGRRALATALAELMPKRLAADIAAHVGHAGNLADLSDARLAEIAAAVEAWDLRPAGSEGYRTAEVTLGGIDTDALNSRTMEAKSVPGLYFIGEAVDVTGWLGGYNFQWAWSSGWAAGTAIAGR
ncbi:MAG: putative Rossmann fold flavoprotein [Paracoccaceae bacterium]|jgi:predicted Rossmann fold flavoprotein